MESVTSLACREAGRSWRKGRGARAAICTPSVVGRSRRGTGGGAMRLVRYGQCRSIDMPPRPVCRKVNHRQDHPGGAETSQGCRRGASIELGGFFNWRLSLFAFLMVSEFYCYYIAKTVCY